MKLIHCIALTQILLFTVDFCSALQDVSKFNGSWVEEKEFRFNVERVLQELGVSEEFSKQIAEGKPSKLQIAHNVTKDSYTFSGFDSLGMSFKFEMKENERLFTQIIIYGKQFWASLTHTHPKLILSISKQPIKSLEYLDVIMEKKFPDFLMLNLKPRKSIDYIFLFFKSVRGFNNQTVFNHKNKSPPNITRTTTLPIDPTPSPNSCDDYSSYCYWMKPTCLLLSNVRKKCPRTCDECTN